MEEYQSGIIRIKSLLESRHEGLSITDISLSLRMNRNSVAKYLDILHVQGAVDVRKVGTSKIYITSRRIAASSIGRVCTRPFIILNHDRIIIEVHKKVEEYAKILNLNLINRHFDTLPFRFMEGGSTDHVLKSTLRGNEQRIRTLIDIKTKSVQTTLILIPVVFDNGKPGISIIIGDYESSNTSDNTESSYLRDLLDKEMEYVVRHTPEGIIRYANEPYCKAIGRRYDEVLGRHFKPIVSEQDRERIQNHFSRLTRQYPSGTIEYRTIMSNGESRWHRWKDYAVFNEKNEIEEFISFGIDITDLFEAKNILKLTRDNLEETIEKRTNELREINRDLYSEITNREKIEQKLRYIQFSMDNAADLVIWISMNSRIRYANNRVLDTLGYEQKDIQSLSFGDLIPEYTLKKWDKECVRLKKSGSSTFETIILRHDQNMFPVEVSMKYMKYAGEEFALCIARDIRERKSMEKALKTANKKLNLISSITRHEVQNKITVLLGFLGRAKKKEKDPGVLYYLDRIERAAKTIRDEINLSRDFKNVGTQPPLWLNLRNMVTSSVRIYKDRGVEFAVDLPDIEIFADYHLERIFLRLIEESISSNRNVTSIKIYSKTGDGFFDIIYADNGSVKEHGDDEYIDNYHENNRYDGLFIAREILSLTDITIEDSRDNESGSCFTIRAPEKRYRNRGM